MTGGSTVAAPKKSNVMENCSARASAKGSPTGAGSVAATFSSAPCIMKLRNSPAE